MNTPQSTPLAAECGLSDKGVRLQLWALEQRGLLVLVALEDPGRRRPREYRLDLDALEKLALNPGTSFRPEPRTALPRNDVPPEPSRTTTIEPSERETRPRTRSTSTDDELDGFADWYAAYPRMRDPGQARKAYRTDLKKTSPAVLLTAA